MVSTLPDMWIYNGLLTAILMGLCQNVNQPSNLWWYIFPESCLKIFQFFVLIWINLFCDQLLSIMPYGDKYCITLVLLKIFVLLSDLKIKLQVNFLLVSIVFFYQSQYFLKCVAIMRRGNLLRNNKAIVKIYLIQVHRTFVQDTRINSKLSL